jgi:hypothetical protein
MSVKALSLGIICLILLKVMSISGRSSSSLQQLLIKSTTIRGYDPIVVLATGFSIPLVAFMHAIPNEV